jgi:hypothetical protein
LTRIHIAQNESALTIRGRDRYQGVRRHRNICGCDRIRVERDASTRDGFAVSCILDGTFNGALRRLSMHQRNGQHQNNRRERKE